MHIDEFRKQKDEAEAQINAILDRLVVKTGMSIWLGSDLIETIGKPDRVRVRITMEIK